MTDKNTGKADEIARLSAENYTLDCKNNALEFIVNSAVDILACVPGNTFEEKIKLAADVYALRVSFGGEA